MKSQKRPKRPQKTGRLRAKLHVTFAPETIDAIDLARGDLITRSRWIELAAQEKLAR